MKRSVDMPFLILVCALVALGLLIFTSAALGLLARGGASFTSVATSQVLYGLFVGGIALLVCSRVDYRAWKRWTPYFFALSLALTALTLTHFGLSLKGASRWLALGPVSFQPQELLKFASVALLAAVYSTRLREIKTFRGGMIPFLVVVGLSSILLIMQPDTAAVVVIGGTASVMLFAAGGRVSYLAGFALVGIAALMLLALQRPYLQARLETFLNPASDSQGAGYQIQQSLIAVGSGGFWGKGFGQSVEKFSYLPEPIGDSIFAVVGEEFGFVGATLLILLFGAFSLLGLRIAARAQDPFGALLAIGLTVLIAGQAFLNIASTLGVVPLLGEPLIFVSHGGTALAISLAEVGVILSVSRRMKSA